MNLRTDNERSIYRKAHDAVLLATQRQAPQVAMAINPEDREQARHAQQQMQALKELTKALDALKGTLRGIDTAMKHDDMQEVAREIQRLGGQVDAIDRAMVRVDY